MTNATEPVEAKHESGPDAGELLLVDKPAGWTSFDVVKKIRSLLRVKKAGHAGTLDPLATGLLIVCTGKMTKNLARHAAADKEYDVSLLLGSRTASGDAETPVIETCSVDGITARHVEQAVQTFIGAQRQIPPMWSALKVNGKRLYKYAKEGQTVERAPRDVLIHAITIRSIELPRVELTVSCSKGTYIRTLVDDLGKTLGCGAYVTSLRRTRIDHWHVADAMTMADLERRARQSMSPVL